MHAEFSPCAENLFENNPMISTNMYGPTIEDTISLFPCPSCPLVGTIVLRVHVSDIMYLITLKSQHTMQFFEQSSVNVLILATTHSAAILWVLWHSPASKVFGTPTRTRPKKSKF